MQAKLTSKSVLGGFVSLLVIAAWFMVLRPAPLGGPASYIIVSGRSMQPTFNDGDLVIMHKAERYEMGDIIAYPVSDYFAKNREVIHRIVGNNGQQFVTRGDNMEKPDDWFPTNQTVLGKAWLHVPGGGRLLTFLQQPRNLGLAIGSLGTISLIAGIGGKRRRKRGGRMTSGNGNNGASSRLPGPAWAIIALGLLGSLAIGLAAVSWYTFSQPIEQSQFVERLRYDHTAAFDYIVQVQPSDISQEELIGPIKPPLPGTTSPITPTIYSKLTRSLDLGFSYTLNSPAPTDVEGEVSAALQIKAEKGWTKVQDLLPPTQFVGPSTSFRVKVDLVEILSLVEIIEKQTGYAPGNYELDIIPAIHVKGQIGNETVDERYAPPFAMKFNRIQITPVSPLENHEARSIGDVVHREQTYHLLGLTVSVAEMRRLSGIAAVFTLMAAAALASIILLGLGQSEAKKIRSRYGTMLISVTQVDLKEDTRKIQVASMRDLARLARRDGGLIFHAQLDPESHLYFVQEGGITYQFAMAAPVEEA